MTSVALTGAAIGTVVAVASVPLFSGLVARWTEGRRVNAGWFWGSGAAVAGCGILMLPGTNDRVDVRGVGCGVLAGALFAAYTVVAKRMASQPVDVRITTGMSMLFGAALLSPLISRSVKDLGRPHAVLVIAWLGLGATAVAYALYSRGLRLVSTTVAGTLNLAEPLAAALLSVFLLGEQLSALEWLGCAVTLGGLLVAVLSGQNGPSGALVLEPSVVAVGCVLMPRDVVLHPALVGSRRVRAVGRASSAEAPGGSLVRTHAPGGFRPSNVYRDSAYAAADDILRRQASAPFPPRLR
jgi:drug/metabolite transporter, DME family